MWYGSATTRERQNPVKFSMLWNFWRGGPAAEGMPLSKQVRDQLALDFSVSEARADILRMVTKVGNFAGRKVTYFRVFSPIAAKTAELNVRQYADLDGYPQLHLYYGNIEGNGEVVLTRADFHPSGGTV